MPDSTSMICRLYKIKTEMTGRKSSRGGALARLRSWRASMLGKAQSLPHLRPLRARQRRLCRTRPVRLRHPRVTANPSSVCEKRNFCQSLHLTLGSLRVSDSAHHLRIVLSPNTPLPNLRTESALCQRKQLGVWVLSPQAHGRGSA